MVYLTNDTGNRPIMLKSDRTVSLHPSTLKFPSFGSDCVRINGSLMITIGFDGVANFGRHLRPWTNKMLWDGGYSKMYDQRRTWFIQRSRASTLEGNRGALQSPKNV